MKTLKELKVGVIKCENKQGCEELKQIHYMVNDVLTRGQFRGQSVKSALRLMDTITDFAKEIKALNCPKPAEPKREEILATMRNYYTTLADYSQSGDSNATPQEVQRIINYIVGGYINRREKYVTPQEILPLLEDMKAITEDYPLINVKTTAFIRLNEELLAKVVERYKISI